MDFKDKSALNKEVESALKQLHEKIASLQEKVDKLCQTTGEFGCLDKKIKTEDKK
jgi:adenine-specific DNA methylase